MLIIPLLILLFCVLVADDSTERLLYAAVALALFLLWSA